MLYFRSHMIVAEPTIRKKIEKSIDSITLYFPNIQKQIYRRLNYFERRAVNDQGYDGEMVVTKWVWFVGFSREYFVSHWDIDFQSHLSWIFKWLMIVYSLKTGWNWGWQSFSSILFLIMLFNGLLLHDSNIFMSTICNMKINFMMKFFFALCVSSLCSEWWPSYCFRWIVSISTVIDHIFGFEQSCYTFKCMNWYICSIQ